MELSVMIVKQILSMFLMIAVGMMLIRLHIVGKETGRGLSRIVVHVILPCTIINAFQIEYTSSIARGFALAFAVAFVCNLFLILFPYTLRFLHLSSVEQASISYPNCGEILIPLVVSVLSKDMQVYCCAFLVIQIVFLFTHGTVILSKDERVRFTDLLKNPNVIAILVGIFIFLGNIRLPEIAGGLIDSFAAMIAPSCMLVIGIAIGDCDWKTILTNKRSYLVCGIRLIVCPLIFLLLFKITGITRMFDGAKDILLIVFMATASSVAATVSNLAQNFDNDAAEAGIINVMSVAFMIITLPAAVMLYQRFI